MSLAGLCLFEFCFKDWAIIGGVQAEVKGC